MMVASWSSWRRPRWGSRAVFIAAVVASALLLLGHLPLGHCQGFSKNMAQKLRKIVNDKLTKLTSSFANEAGKYVEFCVRDTNKEWNEAFNFSEDTTFLERCVSQLNDDEEVKRRLCTSAEIRFYLTNFYSSGAEGGKNYLKPNKNCNLLSWVPGCEPGWACSHKKDLQVNLTEDKNIPERNLNCRPCCEGFFCPHGLTCMIPCPLGAYCPVGTLNDTTGLCDPYNYQLPPGQPNHTCGTADMWADVVSSTEMFCPPGYYCPSTIQKLSCSSGHYCRRGSTAPTKCFRQESCPQNSENQDITIFGALLVVALVLILLIIYNFSGIILTSKGRKQAKSREAAAKHVRETQERLKSAKDAAKKQAKGIQSQLSRTFSRKVKSVDGDSSDSGSEASDKKEERNLTKMMQSIEDDPDGYDGLNVEIGDKNLKKHMPKGKELQTRSQIFKYAYGQIEKEKAMQQNSNLTFSGVMASDSDVRTRLTIEIDFRDLTLILKRNKKKILRSVTGKLHPGHVAAVMGPSGAGKTTFLSALTGKTSGCLATGQVLINGKPDPIRSYKKVIGFVPQDDIVHGNLTVEENLWFSARCRLPADMSKADRVLVVERVIESLGLQAIRESLVGTVEKRGISGGQKKRVNVGLEMVMEPSLLILDEPTSGLDSSSSALLLQACRREALEGVNICMVLHQPSYTLFRMFDDLVLLAKGGLTAYHGPVKTVEEYFSGLGINVPERVNPPDYFIDILEGMIKPDDVDYKELPLRWMLHNGYAVPRDMLQAESTDVDRSSTGSEQSSSELSSSSEPVGKSTAGEAWDADKDKGEEKQEDMEPHSSTYKDLSNRTTPGIFTQYKYFLARVGIQRLREARIQGVDFLILCLAGVCLGTLAKVSDETFGALGYTYTVIAVSLLCKIGALRSFQLERVHYWRERASGMSSLAYFLSRDTIDHFNTIVKPIVYLSMFYFFNNPRSSVFDNYIILVALVYCVTGIGYTFAVYFQPGSAQLWSVLLPVVLTLLTTQDHTSKIMKHLTDLCYTKWALEAFVIANAERYSGVWLVTRCGSLLKNDYDISESNMCLVVLMIYGVVFRAIAFYCMVAFQKN